MITMRSKEAKVKEHISLLSLSASATASRLYLYPIALGYFEYETGYSLWRNSYDSFLLMYLIKGSCLIQYQNEELSCLFRKFYTPGLLSASWILFWWRFGCSLASFWRSSCPFLLWAALCSGNCFFPLQSVSGYPQYGKLVDLFKKAMPIKEYMVSDRITQILNALLNSRSQAKTTFSHSEVIENSLIYISKHFSEHLTMEHWLLIPIWACFILPGSFLPKPAILHISISLQHGSIPPSIFCAHRISP